MRDVMRAVVLGSMLIVLGASVVAAAPPAGRKCQSAKNQEAGKYASCLSKAEAKLLNAGGTCSVTTATECYADGDCPMGETCATSLEDTYKYNATVGKCLNKFNGKWNSLTQKAVDAGDPCPDGLELSDIQYAVDEHVANVAAGLAGEGVNSCGDGAVDGSEDCDLGNLNGGTCAGEGFAGGVLGCGAGCVYDTSGCYAARYVDNGDGTISDRTTGLMWEKKSNDGGIHDKDTTFDWSLSAAAPYSPSGTAYTTFLATLNGGTGANTCFAGHCDWRLPTVEELAGLRLEETYPCGTSPCVDTAFNTSCSGSCSVTACSCTQSDFYWTASTYGEFPYAARLVRFSDGLLFSAAKYDNFLSVRAVRGGS